MSGTDLCESTDITAGYGGPDQVGDELLADLLDALNHWLPAEDYLSLRALGGDHAGILKLTGRRCWVGTIAVGLRAGATCSELNDVGDPWTRLNAYLPVRRNGRSHQDALDSMAAGVNGMDYMKCAEAGATHDEILEVAALSKSQFDYATCRDLGVAHADLVTALQNGINCSVMQFAARKGIGLAELLDAAGRGENPSMYVEFFGPATEQPAD
jgi:hypothetical protein